jgi:hypothetical protein
MIRIVILALLVVPLSVLPGQSTGSDVPGGLKVCAGGDVTLGTNVEPYVGAAARSRCRSVA